VIVVHNAVTDDDDPSTRDVLAQVDWVVSGLEALDLDHRVLAVDGAGPDPAACAAPGTVVVNLVESPPGRPRFQVEAAEALERLGVPFTGSRSEVLWSTTDKLETRRRLAAAGIAIAAGGRLDPDLPSILGAVPPPWILKPSLEDASLGLDEGAVTSDPQAAVARARQLAADYCQPVLVEHLLPGREFNLSLLDGPAGPEVLPPAEMLFVDFPPDRPQVLGWEAKWDDDSFASRHTVRRFLDVTAEARLAERLTATARAAWTVSGAAGYARVDLRLDESGEPCVLEVNANPCLAADAGFVAAARSAGLDAAAVVERLLAAAGATT
jgi:D-alanine-D-alanine ligase